MQNQHPVTQSCGEIISSVSPKTSNKSNRKIPNMHRLCAGGKLSLRTGGRTGQKMHEVAAE